MSALRWGEDGADLLTKTKDVFTLHLAPLMLVFRERKTQYLVFCVYMRWGGEAIGGWESGFRPLPMTGSRLQHGEIKGLRNPSWETSSISIVKLTS